MTQSQPDQTEHPVDYVSLDHEIAELIAEESQSSEDRKLPNILDKRVQAIRKRNSNLAHRGRRYRAKQFWIPELISLLLAFGSFTAILIILEKFNGNLQPNWHRGITINAVIAVLATSFRACLAIIAEEGGLILENY